jgi:hypothetical protein
MSWPGRVAAAAGRATVRLVPPARRDWAEAVLAEAYEVPSGWPRLAWRAGGARLIAREAMVVRRIGILMLFAAAAGAAAWSAWPGHGGHAAVSRADTIATVLLVVGLPLLARWLLGPPDNRGEGRALRELARRSWAKAPDHIRRAGVDFGSRASRRTRGAAALTLRGCRDILSLRADRETANVKVD